MTIEKTMIIPLLLCFVVFIASGIVIDRQMSMQEEHAAIKNEIAGITKACRVHTSP